MSSYKNLPNTKIPEDQLKKELEYLMNHIREFFQNISVGVIRFIEGETITVPLWKLGEDATLALQRIQEIIEELRSRRIP